MKIVSRLLFIALLGTMASPSARADTFYLLSFGGLIKKFSNPDAPSTFAENDLDQPEAMAFDQAGNLYVANSGNDTVEMFAPDGSSSLFAHDSLSKPSAVALDHVGNLYVANSGDGTISKISPKGVGSTFVSIPVGNANRLALDRSDNLYVTTGYDIVKFTPGGVRSIFARCGQTDSFPLGVAFDAGGSLYVSCGVHILRYSPAGVGSVFASFPKTGPAQSSPGPMAFDSQGNLYVADMLSTAIVKFLPDGSSSLFAQAKFSSRDIAIRPDSPPVTNSSSVGP